MHEEVRDRVERIVNLDGNRSVDSVHRELGRLMWDECGMERTAGGLQKAIGEIPGIRNEFWENASVPGTADELNQPLERAMRIADFLEFAEVMCIDAYERNESCGGHFRAEYQTEEGEALRNDNDYSYVAAWEFTGVGNKPSLHKEPLAFEHVALTQRSYK